MSCGIEVISHRVQPLPQLLRWSGTLFAIGFRFARKLAQPLGAWWHLPRLLHPHEMWSRRDGDLIISPKRKSEMSVGFSDKGQDTSEPVEL